MGRASESRVKPATDVRRFYLVREEIARAVFDLSVAESERRSDRETQRSAGMSLIYNIPRYVSYLSLNISESCFNVSAWKITASVTDNNIKMRDAAQRRERLIRFALAIYSSHAKSTGLFAARVSSIIPRFTFDSSDPPAPSCSHPSPPSLPPPPLPPPRAHSPSPLSLSRSRIGDPERNWNFRNDLGDRARPLRLSRRSDVYFSRGVNCERGAACVARACVSRVCRACACAPHALFEGDRRRNSRWP